jgi:MFS family permease
MIDKQSSNYKHIAHGFFLSVAFSVAEQSTILPLIVDYFGGGAILVGIFASLLKGGAVIVQLFAAFYAQSYHYVMPYLRWVFFMRVFAYFLIGIALYYFGDNANIALTSIGLGLFLFSLSAGFGAIYFKEVLAKVFTHKFRGKSMAQKQFFFAFGSIISGGIAGYVLQHYPAPLSYAYLFLLSSASMAVGNTLFSTIKEPKKEKVTKKEKSFREFLVNAKEILKGDKALQNQVISLFLSYATLIAVPFIILKINETHSLNGWQIGAFISIQMFGAMIGNIFWGKLASNSKDKLVVVLSFSILIATFCGLLFIDDYYFYMLVFFLLGACMDGFRLVATNLIIIIAPEEKRPVYLAIQANILSIGNFFSILGGFILAYSNYTSLYIVTIVLLSIGLFFALKLEDVA